MYVGITGIMLGVLGGMGVNVLTSTVKTEALEEVNYNAQNLFLNIVASVHGGDEIITPSLGATSSQLVLAMSDAERNPTIYTVEDGVMMLQEGNSVPMRISTRSVTVSEVTFMRLGAPHSSGAVQIHIALSSVSSSTQEAVSVEEVFMTSASIKKTP